MTKNPDSPMSPTGGQSFSATPTDQARTYQASRDQTINEHHHYAPRVSKKIRMAWSLAGVTILALGSLVGVDAWQRHTATDAKPAADAKAPQPSASSRPSTTPEASGMVVSTSPSPSKAQVQPEPTAPAPSPPPSASASGPPPNPAERCTGWNDSSVPRVQVKACSRFENDRLYMIAEWRTTSGPALVDVYLWLEDAQGKEVVYPGASVKNGLASHSMPAWPTPKNKEQWKEYPVGAALLPGELYQVCVSVQEKGGPKPDIFSPNVKGYQLGVVYP